jgi:hypothetical protein
MKNGFNGVQINLVERDTVVFPRIVTLIRNGIKPRKVSWSHFFDFVKILFSFSFFRTDFKVTAKQKKQSDIWTCIDSNNYVCETWYWLCKEGVYIVRNAGK